MSELIQFLQRIKEKIKSAIMIFSVILECKENILNCEWPMCFSMCNNIQFILLGWKIWGYTSSHWDNLEIFTMYLDVLMFYSPNKAFAVWNTRRIFQTNLIHDIKITPLEIQNINLFGFPLCTWYTSPSALSVIHNTF